VEVLTWDDVAASPSKREHALELIGANLERAD